MRTEGKKGGGGGGGVEKREETHQWNRTANCSELSSCTVFNWFGFIMQQSPLRPKVHPDPCQSKVWELRK